MPLPEALARTVSWVTPGVGLLGPDDGHRGAASLVVAEGDDVLLVDAGLSSGQRRALAPHVDVCLLTHCHVAHARGAADFREVWAPREEARALRDLTEYLETYGVARRDRDLVGAAVRDAGYQPAVVHKEVRPGGILRVGDHEWHLLHTPGHSPGMLALLDPKRHVLFAGDLDGETPPWYGYPTSDPTDLERTLVALEDVPVAHFLTSHAAPRRRGIKQLLRAMSEEIRERDRRLLATLEKPRTLDELTDLGLFLGKPTSAMARYHERVMVEKHLGRLLEKDFAAARQDGRFQRLG